LPFYTRLYGLTLLRKRQRSSARPTPRPSRCRRTRPGWSVPPWGCGWPPAGWIRSRARNTVSDRRFSETSSVVTRNGASAIAHRDSVACTPRFGDRRITMIVRDLHRRPASSTNAIVWPHSLC